MTNIQNKKTKKDEKCYLKLVETLVEFVEDKSSEVFLNPIITKYQTQKDAPNICT